MFKNILKKRWTNLIAVMLVLINSCSKDNTSSPEKSKVDPNTIANAYLIAYFPFDAEPAAGSAVLNSDNFIKYVRKAGNAKFVPGRRGNAYQGDTTLSYLEYDVAPGSALTTLDEFTLSGWIRTPATKAGSAKIFTLNGGDPLTGNLAILQESQPTGDSVNMKVYLFDSASPGWKAQDFRMNRKEFLNDKWFHFIAIYRKATSTIEFYANGNKVASQIKFAGPAPVSGIQPLLETIKLSPDMSKIYFGAWPQLIAGTPGSYMKYYKGMLDEFRIYSKALSEAEITDLYNAELSQINQ